MQVKSIGEPEEPHAKIVVIGLGFPVAALGALRQAGLLLGEDKFGLTVLGRGDNPSDDGLPGGEQAMNGLLGKYPDIDGVLAYNDPSALGERDLAANGRKIAANRLNGGSDGRASVEHGRTAATIENGYPAQLVALIDAIYLLKTTRSTRCRARSSPATSSLTPVTISKVPSWTTSSRRWRRRSSDAVTGGARRRPGAHAPHGPGRADARLVDDRGGSRDEPDPVRLRRAEALRRRPGPARRRPRRCSPARSTG